MDRKGRGKCIPITILMILAGSFYPTCVEGQPDTLNGRNLYNPERFRVSDTLTNAPSPEGQFQPAGDSIALRLQFLRDSLMVREQFIRDSVQRRKRIMESNEVIFYPLMTESASLMVERDNKLIFIVSLKAGKTDIKKAVEELYEVKVQEINTLITCQGQKKAFVKLKPEFKASDVAIKLGIL